MYICIIPIYTYYVCVYIYIYIYMYITAGASSCDPTVVLYGQSPY